MIHPFLPKIQKKKIQENLKFWIENHHFKENRRNQLHFL